MNYDINTIGNIIKRERKKKNLSQTKLAQDYLNYTDKQQLAKWEKGEIVPPLDMLFKLCEIFDCELGYLLGEKEYEKGTKELTRVCDYTGLEPDAISAIRKMTKKEELSFNLSIKYHNTKPIINKLIEYLCTPQVVNPVLKLEDCIQQSKQYKEELTRKYSNEILNKAIKLHTIYEAGKLDITSIESDKIREALFDFEDYLDNQFSIEYKFDTLIKVAKYEAVENVTNIINQLYPAIDTRNKK